MGLFVNFGLRSISGHVCGLVGSLFVNVGSRFGSHDVVVLEGLLSKLFLVRQGDRVVFMWLRQMVGL